ncbi:RES family NAD+ phosphorylase [Bradyrhizobium sp. Pha-3]|uniref:RES family NAD+ phosphorylase n=1 Tax=Bradyrhizobium sp. Pha-3 TaxID=208375 RepID=UPI0035D43256
MIELFPQQTISAQIVLRLAGLHQTSIEIVLLKRGVRPENIAETQAALQLSGAPFSVEEMVDNTFVAKPEYPTPFPIGRYGNGQWPVYYAAQSIETCAAEVGYHLGAQAIEGRYYTLVSCQFDGEALDLTGRQNEYPDLVSSTNAGYPFCQQIGNEARATVSGLHVPSARHVEGMCVPIFIKSSISQPRKLSYGRFVLASNTQVQFQAI